MEKEQTDNTLADNGSGSSDNKDVAAQHQQNDDLMDRASEKRDEGWRPSDNDEDGSSGATDSETDPARTSMGSEATGQTSILDGDRKETNSF